MTAPAPSTAAEIARFLRALFRAGDVFEIRVPKCRSGTGSSKLTTHSGFYTFDAIDRAAEHIAALDDRAAAAGIYVTLNPVNPALLARSNCSIVSNAKETTKDQDIVRRVRLLIDLDPIRPSKVSSTEAELAAARALAAKLIVALRAEGWPDPLDGMSGNGGHLIYEIDLPRDDGGLVERVLVALAKRFNTDAVKIDTSVGNSSRITKVLGTMARKGEHLVGVAGVEDRPHRRSALVSVPATITQVPKELLEKVAAWAQLAPEPPQEPSATRNGAAGADTDKTTFARFAPTAAGVRGYLEKHGIKIVNERTKHGGTIFDLERCPVVADCPSDGTEISVLVGGDGKIAYRNHHDRGHGLKWVDVRDALEPGYKAWVDKAKKRNTKPASRTESAPGPASDEDEGEGADAIPQSERLARLAHERYRFGRTTLDEPFAVRKSGPNVALMFRGNKTALSAALARDYRAKYGKIPNAAGRADALMALEGETLDLDPEQVHMRLARHDGGVVVDLGRTDGQIVFIRDGKWEILAQSPVLFRRSVLTGEIPLPERGGHIDEFRLLLNITNRDWPLFVGWLVSCLIPGIPHPILMLGGEHGTGKSTAARFAALLVDPSPAPLRSAPKDLSDWVVAASGSWVVVLDNMSNIPEWLADAMCRAVTGEGLVKRALFTDSELAVLTFRRVVAITSIDAGALRGDLGDRIVLIDLELIHETARLDDAELEQAFLARRPRLLGALLDVAAAALARLPSVRLPARPRMADFARVLGAVDLVLKSNSVGLFMDQVARIAGTVVESSPVAEAIRMLIENVGEWKGTAGDLLARITPPDRLPPKWPKTPVAMAGQIRRLAPSLRKVGIEVTLPEPTDKTRTYYLRKEGETTALTAQPPEKPSGDHENGDHGRAVDGRLPSNRPDNRPSENPFPEHENAGSGRLGGSGGQNPTLSKSWLGPPDPCRACGLVRWWSISDLLNWTCGGCHDPAAHNGHVIYWIGNERAA